MSCAFGERHVVGEARVSGRLQQGGGFVVRLVCEIEWSRRGRREGLGVGCVRACVCVLDSVLVHNTHTQHLRVLAHTRALPVQDSPTIHV